MVEHEFDYQPIKIPMAKALGLCWNCTDILPNDMVGTIEDFLQENDPPHDRMQTTTYAAAARILLAVLKEETENHGGGDNIGGELVKPTGRAV